MIAAGLWKSRARKTDDVQCWRPRSSAFGELVQRVRVELRLNGELKARYQQRYLNIAECGARLSAPEPAMRKPVRKDHNPGGRSTWMQGFFDRPSPPLLKAIPE